MKLKAILDRVLDSKFLFIVFICKILVLIFFIGRYSSDFPVTNFFDNDGSNTLYVISKTKLWNSNGWWHGPVYYRVAYVVNVLSAYFNISDLSFKQEYIYFTSVLISLFSCILSFYFVFKIFIKKGSSFYLLNLTLISFFLLLVTSDRPFYYFLLMPHPDYLLALLVTISTYYSLRYIEEDSKKSFYLSVFFIGAAISTKLSSVYFAVAFIGGFFYLFGFSRKNVRLALIGVGVAVFSYFLVGFPQNFQLTKLYSFLSNQTRYHLPPNYESITGWFYHLFRNMLPFLPLILCAETIKKEKRLWKFMAIVFGLSFIPFAFTVHTKMEAGHYNFPYFFTLLFFLLLLKTNFYQRGFKFGLLLIAAFVFYSPAPAFFTSQIKEKDLCRGEIKRTMDYVEDKQSDYDEVFLDAYAPYEPKKLQSKKVIWSLRRETFTKNRSLFAINWIYARSFLGEPSAFYAENNPDWEPHHQFYTKIKNNDSFVIDSMKFKKLYSNECGLEVWEAISSSKTL